MEVSSNSGRATLDWQLLGLGDVLTSQGQACSQSPDSPAPSWKSLPWQSPCFLCQGGQGLHLGHQSRGGVLSPCTGPQQGLELGRARTISTKDRM